ncbi:M56 family metallopeptidase [Lacisediminihabitans sp.]|uniref:M56 family metallopeptidase n=1 Tax=Lacisediminihabitans sp. TaxID=2787631 RepID=UPI00374D58C9
MPTWLALAALALVLAWPVPILLSRAQWPSHAPGTALVVWQAIALTGGLSMIGALLTYGLEPFGTSLVDGLVALPAVLAGAPLPAGVAFGQMFALSGAILLGIHLLLNLATTFVRAERSRRRHLQLVSLLSDPMPEQPNARLIDSEAPVAYCLPGTTRSVTVLSAGLTALLDREQLRAVVAHETAHATQRHHIVLLAFRAWRGSLPWFPIATRALDAVAILVEMLADDQALRAVSRETLVRSIALVASASVPVADTEPGPAAADGNNSFADDSPAASRRIARLIDGRPALAWPTRLAAIAGGFALVAVPTVLLLLPAVG